MTTDTTATIAAADLNPTLVPAPSPAPRTKNVLKTLEIVKLHTWITAHAADCRITPDSQLAQIASIELGFPITTFNFRNMREEIGIQKAEKATPPTVDERLTRLEEQVAGMATRYESIEALHSELLLRLASATPQPAQPPYPDTGTIDLPLQIPAAPAQ